MHLNLLIFVFQNQNCLPVSPSHSNNTPSEVHEPILSISQRGEKYFQITETFWRQNWRKISGLERNIKCYGIVLQKVQGRRLALLSPLLFLVLLATIKSNYSCLPEIAPIQWNREVVIRPLLRVKSWMVSGWRVKVYNFIVITDLA